MNKTLFRNNVKWAGLMAIVHIGALIVFAIFISSTLSKYEDNELIGLAHQCALIYDIILWLLFSLFYFKITSTFADFSRELKNAMKEEGFSLISYYRSRYLREDLWRMAIVAAFQLPFAVFYAILGISYLASTPIEIFYALEIGFYGVSGSPILGIILCTLIYSVIYFAFRILFLLLEVRRIKKY